MSALGGAESACEIVVLRHGRRLKKWCRLEPYSGFLDFQEREPQICIQPPVAVLKLDECRCDEAYRDALNRLGEEHQRGTITTLILDLSENMGGSAAVIDEFIRHVDIPSYHRYEMVDYRSGVPVTVVRREDVVENRRTPPYLPRNIFCKVSYTTFSSARTFAVTLKDNRIAAVIGMPTGGRPCSYGMPEKKRTPHHGIRFRVSRCAFLRPDESRDAEEALFPDQSEDILEGSTDAGTENRHK